MQRYKKHRQEKLEKEKEEFFKKYPKKEAVILYDCYTQLNKTIDAFTKELHAMLFGEEYDFMYDDNVDAKSRRLGENPMCEEYQEEVNAKRISLGFLPLDTDGMPLDGSKTKEYCRNKILALICDNKAQGA